MFRKLLPCSCSSSKAKLDNPVMVIDDHRPSSSRNQNNTELVPVSLNSLELAAASTGGQQRATLNLWPLENSLILSKIFQCLPASDLCTCRIVNHQWRQGASKTMRKRPSISATINGLDLSKFTKVMKDCTQNPYSMYDINMLDVTESALASSRKEFSSLCKLIGQEMDGLILGLYDDDAPFFLPKLSKYSPKMNRMFLIILQSEASAAAAAAAAGGAENGEGAGAASPAPSLKSNFFKKNGSIKLPHLRKLGAAWKGQSSPMLDQAIIDIVNGSCELKLLNLQEWKSCPNKILQNCGQKFEKLESLVLYKLGGAQLRLLERNKNIQNLTEFEVNLKEDVEEDIFFEFLKTNSKTLQTLRVSHEGKKTNFKFTAFSQMKQLHTLQLHEWDGPIFVDSIVTNCPKLEVLELKNFHPDNIVGSIKNISSSVDLSLDSLRFLVVKPDGNFPTRKMKLVLKKLVPIFPKMTDFCCVVETDDIFQLILTTINQKVEGILLDMSIEVSDESFSGIPLDVLDERGGYHGHRQCDADDNDDNEMELLACGCWVFKNPGQFRVNPYIGQLQDLTNLQISVPPGTQIGSFALHHGIADLTALRVLRLDTKETKWCLRGIADNLPNLKILELKSRRLYTDEDLQYVNDKLPSLKIEFSNEPEYLYVVRRIPIAEEAG